MMRNALPFPVLAALLATAAAAAQGTNPKDEHVRGDIVAVSGDSMQVRTRGGQEVKLSLAPTVRVAAAQKTTLDSVSQGLFVGTTAVPQPDGTLRAVEVHVFPESMRGTGEGHRPWDLQPSSTMTNATVARVDSQAAGASPTMTNATVAEAAKSAGGRKLQLKYPGGEKTVYVPANTPVVKLEPSERSKLKAGEHVFAVAARQPDGTLIAQRMTIGEGVVPPM